MQPMAARRQAEADVSARISIAVAMARILRRKREPEPAANTNTNEATQQEDRVPDGREGRVTAKGALPRSPRNGLPGLKPYVYRGTGRDELTGHLDKREIEAAAGRQQTPGPAPIPSAAPHREAGPEPESDDLDVIAEETATPEPVPVPGPVRRHRKCGYPVGSIGCRNTCGGSS